jgi:Rogdi leucine zipper containing protein
VAASIFDPPLHPNLSLHFTVHDAALVMTVRTLVPLGSNPHTPSSGSGTATTTTTGTGTGTGTSSSDFPSLTSGFNLRDRLFGLGHAKTPTHDEMGEVFLWRGREEVHVREKVKVESADPSLMSVAAKLSALEHEVRRWSFNLGVVMGEEEEEEEEG